MTEEELNKLEEIVLNYQTLRNDKKFCVDLANTLAGILNEDEDNPLSINIEICGSSKKIPPMKFYNHETKDDFIRFLISWLWDRIHAIEEEIKKL